MSDTESSITDSDSSSVAEKQRRQVAFKDDGTEMSEEYAALLIQKIWRGIKGREWAANYLAGLEDWHFSPRSSSVLSSDTPRPPSPCGPGAICQLDAGFWPGLLMTRNMLNDSALEEVDEENPFELHYDQRKRLSQLSGKLSSLEAKQAFPHEIRVARGVIACLAGVNMFQTEEFSSAEIELLDAFTLLAPSPEEEEAYACLLQEAAHTLGLIHCNRLQFEEAREYFELAKKLFRLHDQMQRNGIKITDISMPEGLEGLNDPAAKPGSSAGLDQGTVRGALHSREQAQVLPESEIHSGVDISSMSRPMSREITSRRGTGDSIGQNLHTINGSGISDLRKQRRESSRLSSRQSGRLSVRLSGKISDKEIEDLNLKGNGPDEPQGITPRSQANPTLGAIGQSLSSRLMVDVKDIDPSKSLLTNRSSRPPTSSGRPVSAASQNAKAGVRSASNKSSNSVSSTRSSRRLSGHLLSRPGTGASAAISAAKEDLESQEFRSPKNFDANFESAAEVLQLADGTDLGDGINSEDEFSPRNGRTDKHTADSLGRHQGSSFGSPKSDNNSNSNLQRDVRSGISRVGSVSAQSAFDQSRPSILLGDPFVAIGATVKALHKRLIPHDANLNLFRAMYTPLQIMVDTYFMLSQVYGKLDQFSESAICFEDGLKLQLKDDNWDATVWSMLTIRLAKYHLTAGNRDLAEDALRASTIMLPTHHAPTFAVAELHSCWGHFFAILVDSVSKGSLPFVHSSNDNFLNLQDVLGKRRVRDHERNVRTGSPSSRDGTPSMQNAAKTPNMQMTPPRTLKSTDTSSSPMRGLLPAKAHVRNIDTSGQAPNQHHVEHQLRRLKTVKKGDMLAMMKLRTAKATNRAISTSDKTLIQDGTVFDDIKLRCDLEFHISHDQLPSDAPDESLTLSEVALRAIESKFKGNVVILRRQPMPGDVSSAFKYGRESLHLARKFFLLDDFAVEHSRIQVTMADLRAAWASMCESTADRIELYALRIWELQPVCSNLNIALHADIHRRISFDIASSFHALLEERAALKFNADGLDEGMRAVSMMQTWNQLTEHATKRHSNLNSILHLSVDSMIDEAIKYYQLHLLPFERSHYQEPQELSIFVPSQAKQFDDFFSSAIVASSLSVKEHVENALRCLQGAQVSQMFGNSALENLVPRPPSAAKGAAAVRQLSSLTLRRVMRPSHRSIGSSLTSTKGAATPVNKANDTRRSTGSSQPRNIESKGRALPTRIDTAGTEATTSSRDSNLDIAGSIPSDVLALILSQLDVPSILRCAKVCRDWSWLSKMDYIWQEQFVRHEFSVEAPYPRPFQWKEAFKEKYEAKQGMRLEASRLLEMSAIRSRMLNKALEEVRIAQEKVFREKLERKRKNRMMRKNAAMVAKSGSEGPVPGTPASPPASKTSTPIDFVSSRPVGVSSLNLDDLAQQAEAQTRNLLEEAQDSARLRELAQAKELDAQKRELRERLQKRRQQKSQANTPRDGGETPTPRLPPRAQTLMEMVGRNSPVQQSLSFSMQRPESNDSQRSVRKSTSKPPLPSKTIKSQNQPKSPDNEEKAAVAIQARARGMQDRKRVADMKAGQKQGTAEAEDADDMPSGADAEKAAVAIQARARGMQDRKRVADMKQS